MSNRLNKAERISLLVLILGVLPASYLGGFATPLQYLLIPFFILMLLPVILGRVSIPRIAKTLIILCSIIVLEVLFTGVFSPLLNVNQFNFPRDAIQYVARFTFLILFLLMFYKSEINLQRFMYFFIGVLLFGMMVGVFQFYNWGGVSAFFREVYSFTEKSLAFMNRENYFSKRVTGIANHATANGGLAAFTLALVVSMYMFFNKKLFITLIGIVLVLFNVIASQARMGYLTIAFSLVIFYLVYMFVKNRRTTPTIKMAGLVTIISFSIYWLYNKGNEFVVRAAYRWEVLDQQVSAGGNRVGQVKDALALLDHPFDFIFGISRGVQHTIERLYIEVEVVNIFVLYGAAGFVLQYSLIVLLLFYFFTNLKRIKNEPILLAMSAASFVGLLSYQFFSFAFYFFREVYVGLFPWILMGATIGAIERYKKNKKMNPEYKINELPAKRRKIVW